MDNAELAKEIVLATMPRLDYFSITEYSSGDPAKKEGKRFAEFYKHYYASVLAELNKD